MDRLSADIAKSLIYNEHPDPAHWHLPKLLSISRQIGSSVGMKSQPIAVDFIKQSIFPASSELTEFLVRSVKLFNQKIAAAKLSKQELISAKAYILFDQSRNPNVHTIKALNESYCICKVHLVFENNEAYQAIAGERCHEADQPPLVF